MPRCAAVVVLLVAAGPGTAAGEDPPVVFMKPVAGEKSQELPLYDRVDDRAEIEKYFSWMDNESARLALGLYEKAWETVQSRSGSLGPFPPYHIALVPGGNHAALGFRLRSGANVDAHPDRSYIKLGPRPYAFENTLLHETGHVVLATLAGGRQVVAEPIAAIPHTTAALTNRGTAFNEGFAIHLETLAAHLGRERHMRARYHGERFDFGGTGRRSAYYRHAVDLASFSQTVARYYEVRENNYAFASAYKGPDYLRVQLEKARDFAALRDANQLLQSEGFYASFFFAFTARGEGIPDSSTIADRQHRALTAPAEMFASRLMTPDAPWLLYFVETCMQLYPDEAGPIVDLLTDLSHGVFVDAEAAALWRAAYLAALTLDIRNFPPPAVKQARARWRQAILADPSVLYARLGPQVPCSVPDRSVRLAAFGTASPLAFDVNTVQEGIMRMIPGVTEHAVDRWLAERARRPFASPDDFRERLGADQPCLEAMQF